jgi:hypothetical protein
LGLNEWRKIHNEELDDLYSLTNIQVFKLRELDGHVWRRGL